MADDAAWRPITGIILAGGASRRFGSDKASAMLLGEPLLQHVWRAVSGECNAVIVAASALQVLPHFAAGAQVTICRDDVDQEGPLRALATALTASETEWNFVVSCDAPLIRPELIRYLCSVAAAQTSVVVPRVGGRLQPLVAVYSKRSLPGLRARLDAGERSLTAAVVSLEPQVVEEAAVLAFDPDLRSFHNINTVADLKVAETLLTASRET
ncbi:MAG: molybdenum cofactor guanylyltransferase [bacterium]